jgi:hypothetical protein
MSHYYANILHSPASISFIANTVTVELKHSFELVELTDVKSPIP